MFKPAKLLNYAVPWIKKIAYGTRIKKTPWTGRSKILTFSPRFLIKLFFRNETTDEKGNKECSIEVEGTEENLGEWICLTTKGFKVELKRITKDVPELVLFPENYANLSANAKINAT